MEMRPMRNRQEQLNYPGTRNTNWKRFSPRVRQLGVGSAQSIAGGNRLDSATEWSSYGMQSESCRNLRWNSRRTLQQCRTKNSNRFREGRNKNRNNNRAAIPPHRRRLCWRRGDSLAQKSQRLASKRQTRQPDKHNFTMMRNKSLVVWFKSKLNK